jgi:PPOX class probable F420-dependent enzyme
MLLSDARRTFLDGRHYAVLGTLNPDGSIQQTVVWYLRDGEQIRISIGAESVKARNLRHSPTIALTIEDGPRYLTLSGSAALEPADPELRRRLALRYLPAERVDGWLASRPDAPRASIRVMIERVYGQGV